MATVEQWTPFEVALDITANASTITRTSATQYTVKINASWETYYSGAQTNYGMTASSGGGSVNLNTFGTKSSSGSGSFTGTYSISGNGSATKSVTVTFKNYEEDWQGNVTKSATKTVSFNVDVPAWTSYTVSYNANGGSGAPTSQTKWKDQTLTLSSTKPTKSGYTFIGWGTSTTDTTADYNAGGSYTSNASVTLYAIWSKTITLTYNANGGSGAPSSQSATVYNATTSYNFTLSSGKPSKTGYTFLGWSTSSTATSSSYSAGGSITLSNASTLYAVWSENKLTINYYSNNATSYNGTSTAKNTVNNNNVLIWSQDYYYDNAYSSGLNNYNSGSTLGMIRTGYTGTGNWGTSTNGGTLVHQDTSFSTGQSLAQALGKDLSSSSASINIYAQWRVNVLTIKYNINGGKINSDTYYASNNLICNTSSSSVLEDKWNYNSTHTNGLYNASTFGLNREGYKFVGWGTSSLGEPMFDQDDTSIVPTNMTNDINTSDCEITLYAIWKLSGVVYIDNGTTLEAYLPYIDNGTSWDLYLAYIDNGTSWDTIS